MGETSLELADVFRAHGKQFRAQHPLAEHHRNAMWAIENCRSAALGGHIDACTNCKLRRFSFNSCGNRHCPKCQGAARQRWVAQRKAELLPIEYFHVVFTLPHRLIPIIRCNQRQLLGLLFRASAETLLAFGRRHLKGEVGITTVLHTWGQNLSEHPHVHCIVTGGAISSDRASWKMAPKGYLFPVKALSKVYRGKFCDGLRQAWQQGRLALEGPIAHLEEPESFDMLMRLLYEDNWVVFTKPPFAEAEALVGYVGRYTHRVALSNQRLVAFENGQVTFRWKDYRHCAQQKLMNLPAEEFIRRFLLHVMPKGMVRIRHFGLFANRGRAERLLACRHLLQQAIEERFAKLTQSDHSCLNLSVSAQPCPRCGEGVMLVISWWPKGCDPPEGYRQSGANCWMRKAA